MLVDQLDLVVMLLQFCMSSWTQVLLLLRSPLVIFLRDMQFPIRGSRVVLLLYEARGLATAEDWSPSAKLMSFDLVKVGVWRSNIVESSGSQVSVAAFYCFESVWTAPVYTGSGPGGGEN